MRLEWNGVAELRKMFENPPERKTELVAEEAPRLLEAPRPIEAPKVDAGEWSELMKEVTRLAVNWEKLAADTLAARPKTLNELALLVKAQTGASKKVRTNIAKSILKGLDRNGAVRLQDTFRTWRYEWL